MSADQGVPSSIEAGDTAATDPKSAAAPASEPSSTPKPEAPRTEGKRAIGTLMVLPPGEREWDGSLGSERRADEAPRSSGSFRKRRLAAMAAVAVLALIGGAVGGALATAGLGRIAAHDDAASASQAAVKQAQALNEQIARIDADLAALKSATDQVTKTSGSQASKLGDRFEKLEKAQADASAKLARLNETVDKLKATPVAAAPAAAAPVATVSARETTGSITPAAPKPEVARLPTVDGWVLRQVSDGGALIESRQGVFEVYAGDPVPGLGRVDAIRRQDGRWVVVTSRGLIVAR